MRKGLWLACLMFGVFAHAQASATPILIDLGGGIILDTVSGLEWEQNASSSFAGLSQAGAADYANTLVLDGPGWRLPKIWELERIENVLISLGECTVYAANWVDCMGDQGPFVGIRAAYWSGTGASPPYPDGWGYIFQFQNGLSDGKPDGDDFKYSAWAVRGEAAPDPAVIPEPASLIIFGTGLLGLGMTRLFTNRRSVTIPRSLGID